MRATPDELLSQVCALATDQPGDVRAVVTRAVDRSAPLATDDERARLIEAAVARLDGLDVLQGHLADDRVDEILVNRGTEVWVERDGRLRLVDRLPDGAIEVVLQRILAPTGRRLDRTTPIIDTRLPDGSRVCAAVAPVAVDGTVVAIRRHRHRHLPLEMFAGPEVVALVGELVDRRSNVLVTGATSSGKTTLLGAALADVSDEERLVVIEDTTELAFAGRHVVRLEARPATADGVRAVDTDELVRTALRLRPDRLVVGEFRGTEALAVVQALNTGHAGSWATCHANGALDGLRRLSSLVLQAAPSWPMSSIRDQVTRSIDAVVHVRRDATGRTVDHVVEPVPGGGEPAGRDLVRGGRVVATPERRR